MLEINCMPWLPNRYFLITVIGDESRQNNAAINLMNESPRDGEYFFMRQPAAAVVIIELPAPANVVHASRHPAQ